MANYFDDSSTCDQDAGRVNLLCEDCEPLSTFPTLGSTDGPATFCMRCRSLSNASSNYQIDADVGTREWVNSLENAKSEIVGNGYHTQPCADGADMPLLEGNATNACWKEVDSSRCHASSSENCEQNSKVFNQLLIATILCLIFMAAEALGGWLAGSLAVQTDAAHLLSDVAGFGGSLLAMRLVRRPASQRFSYGWLRAEPLAALASVMLLWGVTACVAAVALHRLVHPQRRVDADGMMLVSALGVLVNVVMGVALHGGCSGSKIVHHGHSHVLPVWDFSTSVNEVPESSVNRNINVRAAVIHVVGDLVQSVGVFIAAVLIKCFPEAQWLDPVCSLLCCILVLATSFAVARDAFVVLLEACPSSAPALQPAALTLQLRDVEGVCNVQDVHVWALTPGHAALTAHLTIEPTGDHEDVLKKAHKMLRRIPELKHITLQISSS